MRRPPGPEGQQDSLRVRNDPSSRRFQLGRGISVRSKKKPFTGAVKGFEGLEDLGALAFVVEQCRKGRLVPRRTETLVLQQDCRCSCARSDKEAACPLITFPSALFAGLRRDRPRRATRQGMSASPTRSALFLASGMAHRVRSCPTGTMAGIRLEAPIP